MLPCKAACFDFFLRVISFNLRSCSASASRFALKYANSSPSDSEKLDEESEGDDDDDEYDDFNESSRLRLFPSSSSSMVSELPEDPKSAISDDTSCSSPEDFCFELLLRRLRPTLRLPSCCSYSSDEVSEGEGLEEPSC